MNAKDPDNRFIDHPMINISDNRNSTITDNTFIIESLDYPVPITFKREGMKNSEIKDLLTRTQTIESIISRERNLVEKLEVLHSLNKRTGETFSIRFWGMYSGISTIRSSFDSSELGALELDEKKLLISLIEKRFPVKMILTLNVEKVLSFGFSIDDIRHRIADMCEVCEKLKKYDNFQFVIDEESDIDSTIAVDAFFMMKQYDFDSKSFNYKKAYWTSDIRQITGFCDRFERQYSYLNRLFINMCRVLQTDDYNTYINIAIDNRIKNYYKQFIDK